MDEDNDIFAQVGIGAMIIFIASLLAVTSSMYVMIGELERLSQSAEEP